MDKSFEERYMDVLQSIEFSIVSFYHENPELVDYNVDKVLEGLVRSYQAEARGRSAPKLRFSPLEEVLLESVRQVCELQLGRGQSSEVSPSEEGVLEVRTLDEIIACLKRLRSSLKLWNKQGGKRGYLEFVEEYLH